MWEQPFLFAGNGKGTEGDCAQLETFVQVRVLERMGRSGVV